MSGAGASAVDLAALLRAAEAARARAYAPYSNFRVGAAVWLADGTIATGANIENASYGLTVCAERTALFGAVARGERAFLALAVTGPPETPCAPCGACRQVIAEFMPREAAVVFRGAAGVATTTVEALLPHAFALP